MRRGMLVVVVGGGGGGQMWGISHACQSNIRVFHQF